MRGTVQLAVVAVLAAALAPAARSAAPAFTVTDASVSPSRAYFAGAPVRIAFTIAAAAPLDLRVDIVREATRKPVRRLSLPAPAQPGVTQRLEWDGVTGGGEVAPNGTYRVRVTGPGGAALSAVASGTARNAGTFTLRSHVYPIRGPHADRGPIGAASGATAGARTRASTSTPPAGRSSSPRAAAG